MIIKRSKKKQIIEVVPYDTSWPQLFLEEQSLLKEIFSENYVSLHHIGSTSVKNLAAKPTIDMILVVNDINKFDQLNDKLTKISYEAWGEYGISGRRFFVKGEQKRTHHLHVFQKDSDEIDRHLHFRDYLNSFPEEAKKYGELKLELAKKFKDNRKAYYLEKEEHVKLLESKALVWFERSNKSG